MDIRIVGNSVYLLCAISWLCGLICWPLGKYIIQICSKLSYIASISCCSMRKRGETVTEYESDDDSDIKLVLCVRTDLEMGKGKIAAQCGHAALGAYIDSINRKNPYLNEWMNQGQKKVVLKVKSKEDMAELKRSAAAAHINYHITCDAGRTQIPAGSYTVIAIGPAPENVVNKITGHLKLL